jgi:HSP20 family molecular chaperone IbpA
MGPQLLQREAADRQCLIQSLTGHRPEFNVKGLAGLGDGAGPDGEQGVEAGAGPGRLHVNRNVDWHGPLLYSIPWELAISPGYYWNLAEESPLPALRQEVNRLFDDFFASPFGLAPFGEWSGVMDRFSPKIDVTGTDDEIAITAELPGMDEENIQILLDHNTLVISGEKKDEVEEKGRRYYRLERSYGAFRRSIPILATPYPFSRDI